MDKSLCPSASRLHLLILVIVCADVKSTGGGCDKVNKMAAGTKCVMGKVMGSQTKIWRKSVDSDLRSYSMREIARLSTLAPQDKLDKLGHEVSPGWHLLFLVVCTSVQNRVGDGSMVLDKTPSRSSCTCGGVAAFQTHDIYQNSTDIECCDIMHLPWKRLIHEHHYRNYSDNHRKHFFQIEILLCLTIHVILQFVLKNRGKLLASNRPIFEMSFGLHRGFYVSHKICDSCGCRKQDVSSCGLNREFNSLTISSSEHWTSVSNILLGNVFCCTDHNKKKDKSCLMSCLLDIPAALFVSLQHLWVYPITNNAKTDLSRVQDGVRTPRDEEMRYEVRRLASYSNVPVRASPMRLAQSGFYATGSGDETRCYSCRMTNSDWNMMDQPDQIHRSISPDCPHLNGKDERNVPMRSESNNITGVFGVTGECHGIALPEVTTATPIVSQPVVVAPTSSEGLTPSNLPELDISKAVYPQYRDLSRRLDSYQGWGSSHVQDHQVLARAGFYYAGYRDCVRCFYCGVGLRSWEREDDPWVEHVRWRSSCDYVRLMKGEQFVIQALANGSAVSSSPLTPMNTQTPTVPHPSTTNDQDAITKAEEMGFQRHVIERAVRELSESKLTGQTDVIQLETLLEKLMSDELTAAATTSTTATTTSSSSSSSTTTTSSSSSSTTTMSSSSSSSTTTTTTTATTTTTVTHSSSLSITVPRYTTPTVSHTSPPSGSSHAQTTSKKESQTTSSFTETATVESVGIVAGEGTTNVNTAELTVPKGNACSSADRIRQVTDISTLMQERQLEEENQSLRDESTCKICLDNPSCIVFLPCGHLVTCAECAPALRKCPICRALIRGTVRAHMDSFQ